MLSGCATWTRYVLSVNVILACLDSTHCRPLQFIRKGRKLLIKITCKFLSACLLFGWLCEFLQRHQAQQWPYVFQSLCVIAARSSKCIIIVLLATYFFNCSNMFENGYLAGSRDARSKCFDTRSRN